MSELEIIQAIEAEVKKLRKLAAVYDALGVDGCKRVRAAIYRGCGGYGKEMASLLIGFAALNMKYGAE